MPRFKAIGVLLLAAVGCGEPPAPPRVMPRTPAPTRPSKITIDGPLPEGVSGLEVRREARWNGPGDSCVRSVVISFDLAEDVHPWPIKSVDVKMSDGTRLNPQRTTMLNRGSHRQIEIRCPVSSMAPLRMDPRVGVRLSGFITDLLDDARALGLKEAQTLKLGASVKAEGPKVATGSCSLSRVDEGLRINLAGTIGPDAGVVVVAGNSWKEFPEGSVDSDEPMYFVVIESAVLGKASIERSAKDPMTAVIKPQEVAANYAVQPWEVRVGVVVHRPVVLDNLPVGW